MNVGQQVYWLAAGQIIAPEEYSDRLESFVAGTQRRMRHLTTMLVGHRADIRVACGGFNVPVEIKRSCHPEWCSAVKTQLIAKYTRDPGADGYGIYLVFWFGEAEGCPPVPASGRKPMSPDEMRQAILDTLSATERRKIHVCVIDVSEPA